MATILTARQTGTGLMSRPDDDRTPGNASRMPEDRLAHESRLEDQRPREKKRTRVTALLFVSGFAVGALLLVLVAWVASSMTDSDASLVVYLVAAFVGGGIGAALLPYVSLARADGDDAAIVRDRDRTGRADAPIEGAEAVDERRQVQ